MSKSIDNAKTRIQTILDIYKEILGDTTNIGGFLDIFAEKKVSNKIKYEYNEDEILEFVKHLPEDQLYETNSSNNSIMFYAVHNKHEKIIKYLLFELNYNFSGEIRNILKNNMHDKEIIDFIFDRNDIFDLNIQENYDTMIELAIGSCSKQDRYLLDKLLDYIKLNPNLKLNLSIIINKNNNLLQEFITSCNDLVEDTTKICNKLLDLDPIVDINHVNKCKNTALILAAQSNYQFVNILIKKYPSIDMNIVNDYGKTAADYLIKRIDNIREKCEKYTNGYDILFCCFNYEKFFTDILCDNLLDFDTIDNITEDKNMALILAAKSDHKLVKILIKENPAINMNIVDDEGNTAVYYLAKRIDYIRKKCRKYINGYYRFEYANLFSERLY